jgi:transcriptional regulator with XRE-family HTH domain/ribosomal protein L40E
VRIKIIRHHNARQEEIAMTELGQRIFDERKKLGLSQGDLAMKIGVSTKAVSKWETGEAQPTLDNVNHLAEVFGVTTDYLIGGKGTETNSSAPKKSNFQYLEDQKTKRHGLRIAGWICLGLGILIVAAGLVDFFQAFNNFGMPHLFFLFYIGGPLAFVGIVLLAFGYMGAINRYSASEMAPVARDTTNYMLDGTREETTKTINSVVSGVASGLKGQSVNANPIKGAVCARCGTQNEPGAAFCDNCGAPLHKKCPKCGEENDADAKFCRKCGQDLR